MRLRHYGGTGFAALIVGTLVIGAGSAPSRAAINQATPCAEGSPVAVATPAVVSCPLAGPVVDLGTPAAVAGLTISLTISSDQAGPVVMTVEVTDERGAPVSDATVVVKARHLDMDMGEFPHDALPTAPGVYVAERVGMGMGGNWRVEVDVTRAGNEPIAAYFLVTMEGLQ
jgi:hypothetical protein